MTVENLYKEIKQSKYPVIAFEGPNNIGKTTLILNLVNKFIKEDKQPLSYISFNSKFYKKDFIKTYFPDMFSEWEIDKSSEDLLVNKCFYKILSETIKLKKSFKLFVDRLPFGGIKLYSKKLRGLSDKEIENILYFIKKNESFNKKILVYILDRKDYDWTKHSDEIRHIILPEEEKRYFNEELPKILDNIGISYKKIFI